MIKLHNVTKNQELFFNQSSSIEIKSKKTSLMFDYVNKEQINGFKWISDAKTILEYGCGHGTSLDLFLRRKKNKKYIIYGVDIAEQAIKRAKEKYSQYRFYKIKNNKIPQIKNRSLDASYMFHVLHHARNHIDIFREIYLKLRPGGKFLLSDLSSNNIINKVGRFVFLISPHWVKNKFSDDLVVHGHIPEKYKVDIKKIIKQLDWVGFSIEEIGYGHLFFFVFDWLDRFMPLSKFRIAQPIYESLIKFENLLLKYRPFQNQAEVFYIKCLKK